MSKIASFSLAALVALSLAACGDDKKTGTPAPSTTPSASSSGTPSAPSTPTADPSTGSESVQRTKAELTKALLALPDLPSGFSLETDDPGDEAENPLSSKDPKCKSLVKFLNADQAPGSKVSVTRSFSGGQEGPYIDFGVDAMGDSQKVLALQSSYRAAVRSCKKITMKFDGQGSSAMDVREVSAPQFGDDPFAFRLTSISGPQEGLEVVFATAGVNDVVVSVSIVAGQPGELDSATEAAVGKAKKVLGGKKSGT
ncbi:sensor domain-containing protein [Kribbella qitaiheensis]|nr:sensor domain-containing protein [Kribbella qitaiheensis]